MIFADGIPIDEYFETTEGPFWVTGRVRIVSTHLFLTDLLIYPTTGSSVRVGPLQLLRIVRILIEAMREQGLEHYSLDADRMHAGKPQRMISVTRRLR